jgi:hypothetical protein
MAALSPAASHRALPVTAAPEPAAVPAAAVAPTAPAPAPVAAATPAPAAAMPPPVPAATPPHFFGLEAVDILLGGDRRAGLCIRRRQSSVFCERMRRQRRCLRARSQSRGAGGESKGEFQKVAAFHDISLFVDGE